MESHYEVACDNDAPDSLLAALRERVIVPWFREGDGMYAKEFAARWHTHSAPARVCHGAQTFYWALFPIGSGQLKETASSFSSYLRERETVV